MWLIDKSKQDKSLVISPDEYDRFVQHLIDETASGATKWVKGYRNRYERYTDNYAEICFAYQALIDGRKMQIIKTEILSINDKRSCKIGETPHYKMLIIYKGGNVCISVDASNLSQLYQVIQDAESAECQSDMAPGEEGHVIRSMIKRMARGE